MIFRGWDYGILPRRPGCEVYDPFLHDTPINVAACYRIPGEEMQCSQQTTHIDRNRGIVGQLV